MEKISELRLMLYTTFNIWVFIFLFLFSSILCWAGEIIYYSPDGIIITKDEYEKLCEENSKKIDKIKKERLDALQKQTDKYGRPLFDSQGRNISYGFIDSEEENKQKKKLKYDLKKGLNSEVQQNKYRTYSHKPKQHQVNKTPEQKYWDEKLQLERAKLLLEKRKIQQSEFFELMKILKGKDRSRDVHREFQDSENDRRLREIESNTRAIKRKLEW